MNNKPRIVITGSNGFIGSKLFTKLSKLNKNIFCLDRSKHSLFEVESLKNLLADAEVIYHLAGSTAGNGHNPGQDALIKNNVEATSNLIEGISKFCKKPPLLVNMSTIQVYDKSVSEILETTNLSPANIYGISKLVQETLVRQASNMNVIRSIIFRASNIYGEGHRPNHNSVIATFCHQIKNDIEVNLFAKGEAILDLIHVDSVIDVLANIRAINKNNSQIYNLASGNAITINEVIENLQKISGSEIKTKLVEGERRKFSINVDKLKNDYPDIKYCNIFDGLKKTYEYD